MQIMERRHPAHSNPSYLTNALLAYMTDASSREAWAEPSRVVAAIYHVVSREKKIPTRVPLGADAYRMILDDPEKTKREVEALKDVSVVVD